MTQARMHTQKLILQNYALLLYFLAVMFMPFTGMAGPAFMGELARSLSVWFVLSAVGIGLLTYKPINPSSSAVVRLALAFIGLLAMGLFANFSHVFDMEFRERSGANKYFSSVLVILYGFGFSWITSNILQKSNDLRADFKSYIVRPTMFATLITGCVAVVEVAWWYIPSLGGLMKLITLVLRPYSEEAGFWGRLTTVAFEPHSFGLWLGFALVIMLWVLLWEKGSPRKKYSLFVFAAVAIMLYLSHARGGFIITIATFSMAFLMWLMRHKPQSYSKLAVLPLLGCLAICVLQMSLVDTISNYVLDGSSVSNLSRFGMNVAAFNMFYDNPFIGVGFGQFAFHATGFVPSWGWYSPEINAWLIDQNSAWPSSFSMYGRLLSETGLIGFGIWYLGGFVLFHKAIRNQLAKGDTSLAALLVLLMTFNFFYGVSVETFNHLGLWISLGVASAALAKTPESSSSDA